MQTIPGIWSALTREQEREIRAFLLIMRFFSADSDQARQLWPEFQAQFRLHCEILAAFRGLSRTPGELILQGVREWAQNVLPVSALLADTDHDLMRS